MPATCSWPAGRSVLFLPLGPTVARSFFVSDVCRACKCKATRAVFPDSSISDTAQNHIGQDMEAFFGSGSRWGQDMVIGLWTTCRVDPLHNLKLCGKNA